VIEKMVLVFGKDCGALVMKVPNADNGAIAEIIVVFLLCAVYQLVVYFPCGLEMPPEEAHQF
jgi:hypothetical protein